MPRSRSSKQAVSSAWSQLIPETARALLGSLPDGDPPRKHPRDVAALFVDIQGCTRLCEDLPAVEMNEVIERYFSVYLDVVRRAGGEVTEVLGDGLLALVGFTRLRGRSGERWVYAATGPVTNVAARLCALGTDGQILTTRAVADLLTGECDCRPVGQHSLKNVTGPVEVVEIRLVKNDVGGA